MICYKGQAKITNITDERRTIVTLIIPYYTTHFNLWWGDLKFPNIALLIVVGLVFWMFLLQLAVGIGLSSYNILIFIMCAIGIVVALITTGGK